jgi:hypothetical protein
MSGQRQANRFLAVFIGLTAGIAWVVADMILPITESISDSDLIPYNWKHAVAKILLPMAVGALATIVVLEARTVNVTESMRRPSRAARLGWMLYGAVGAVGWWIVPLVLSFVIRPLLFISAIVGSSIAQGLATPFYGTFANTPRFLADAGLYAGGAIVGAGIGLGLGTFMAGLVREVLGKQLNRKKHLAIGATLGVVLGLIYSAVYVSTIFISGLFLQE